MTNRILRRVRSIAANFLTASSSGARFGMGALLLAVSFSAVAETPAAVSAALPMVTQRIDNASRVKLGGSVHPLAQSRYDRGSVDSSLQAPRIQMMLSRPGDREAALKQFISDAHTKGAANYHKWLTPDQFGKQFGPADSDVAAVTAWLQSQGLTVNRVSRGKSVIEFGGSTAQVQAAFGTSIHKYFVNGETHYANATPATIPSALAPAVKGLVSLNNFKLKSQIKVLGKGTYSPVSRRGTGDWNLPDQGIFYVDPGDFAVQYDTAPLLSAGTTGTGVTIGIINDSNIDVTLVNAYRTLFSLPASTPQVIVDGNDPGVNSDSIEAYLDVEQAGAVAPGATVNLYVGEDTALSAGLDLATTRAVDDDTAQILNLSFGNCEAAIGSENAFYAYEWEQAAAQGQTVTVASGDDGSEQCAVDTDSNGNPVYGLAVSGAASTPYNVAVGGTDFYYSDYATQTSTGLPTSFGTYWNNPLVESDSPATSILKTIPEQPWNDSIYGLNLAITDDNSAATSPVGGGGGASSCSTQDSSGNCIGGYAKPAYQSGITPADSVRDVPDVALFAANGYNFSAYPICASPGDCNSDGQSASPETITGVGGTSASAPAFAGIMAMVVQKYGAQGEANYTLYPLFSQFPSVFHDVTVGSNNEPCVPGGPSLQSPCTQDATGGTFSVQDYAAATGYDRASGLGSVDANVLVTNWNSVTFTSTTTALTVSPSSVTHGGSVTLTANVTSSSATGDVAFTTNAALPNNKGLGFGTLASGVATVSSPSTNVADLPGGTYNITAQYEGDGTYAPSTSTTQSITVNPEASTTYITAFNYYQETVITGGTTNVPYGTSIVIDAQPVGTAVSQTGTPTIGSINTDGAATGSVAFTDGGTSSKVAINAGGVAEWNPGTFAIGSHSVTAKYSGDASFNASTSSAVAFTVVKGTPLVSVVPLLSSQQSGSNLTVQVYLCNSEANGSSSGCGLGAGTAPTGTVVVTLGSQTQTATLVTTNSGSGIGGISTVGAGNYSSATVTFTGIPANATSVSAVYSGDSNWNTASGASTFSSATGSLTASTTTLTATPASGTNNANPISFTSTITGTGSKAPTGTLTIYDNGSSLGGITLTATAGEVTISGDVVTVTVTANGSNLYGGSNQFVAVYSGDTSYAASSSTVSTAAVDQSDFVLSSPNAVVPIAAGSSATATLNLNSISGFNAAVSLTCASANTAFTCSVSPGSVSLNGTATATVNINASSSAALQYPLKQDRLKPFWFAGGSLALACLVFFGIPARQRGWRSMLGLVMFAVLTINFGCGGSSGGGGGGGGTTTVATPTFSPAAGTYSAAQSVTISDATSGATIYYTTDGSTPTASSTKYTAAISVAKTETVNAIATASGDNNSTVGSAAYTISAAGGGSDRTFGSATPANTVVVTATSSGANPEIHAVTIQMAVQ